MYKDWFINLNIFSLKFVFYFEITSFLSFFNIQMYFLLSRLKVLKVLGGPGWEEGIDYKEA